MIEASGPRRPIRDSGCNHYERPSILVSFAAGAVREAMMKMSMVTGVISAVLRKNC
jgi:hypothetical protein